jgi:hypothetical protein
VHPAHQVQQALRRYQSELISALLPAEIAEPLVSAFIRAQHRGHQAGRPDFTVPDHFGIHRIRQRAIQQGGHSQSDRLSAHQVQQALRRYQSELISALLPAEIAEPLVSAVLSQQACISRWLSTAAIRRADQISPCPTTSAYTALRRYQSELISALLPAEIAEPLVSAFIRDLEKLGADQISPCPTTSAYTASVSVPSSRAASFSRSRMNAAVLSQRDMQACWLDARDFLRAERAAQPQVDEGPDHFGIHRIRQRAIQQGGQLLQIADECRD